MREREAVVSGQVSSQVSGATPADGSLVKCLVKSLCNVDEQDLDREDADLSHGFLFRDGGRLTRKL